MKVIRSGWGLESGILIQNFFFFRKYLACSSACLSDLTGFDMSSGCSHGWNIHLEDPASMTTELGSAIHQWGTHSSKEELLKCFQSWWPTQVPDEDSERRRLCWWVNNDCALLTVEKYVCNCKKKVTCEIMPVMLADRFQGRSYRVFLNPSRQLSRYYNTPRPLPPQSFPFHST